MDRRLKSSARLPTELPLRPPAVQPQADALPNGLERTTIDGIRVTFSGRALFDNGDANNPVVRTR